MNNKRKLNESLERQLRSSIPFIAEIITEGSKGRNNRAAKSSNKKKTTAQTQPEVTQPTVVPIQPQPQSQPTVAPKPMGILGRLGSVIKQGAAELAAHAVNTYTSTAKTTHEQSQAGAYHNLLGIYSQHLGRTPTEIHTILSEHPSQEPLPPSASHPNYADLLKSYKVSHQEWRERKGLEAEIEGLHRAHPNIAQFAKGAMRTAQDAKAIANDPRLDRYSAAMRQRAEEESKKREEDRTIRRGQSKQTP